MRASLALWIVAATGCGGVALRGRAAPGPAARAPTAPAPLPAGECLDQLVRLDVAYRPAEPTVGVAEPVEILGPVGGVTYHTWIRRRLILDCVLVRALALIGPV